MNYELIDLSFVNLKEDGGKHNAKICGGLTKECCKAVEPIDVVLMTKKGGDVDLTLALNTETLRCCVKKKIQSGAHYFHGGVDSNLD
ncbi:hypothetical protein MKW98_011461, partial [Papaver atlanticum]